MSIGLVFLGILAATTPASASHGDHVVIAEVQVGGTSAKDEFVELYNPTGAAIPLEGWRLSKRTGSGAREENLVTAFPALTIAPHASVLIAHPEGAFATSADQKYTTQSSLASDNTVVLYGPVGSDGQRSVVDFVGFGTATSREGTAAANPENGQSIERKLGGAEGNGQDTGDNSADFVIQATPTPQGASAPARPTITVAEPSAPASDTTTTSDASTADPESDAATPAPSDTSQPSAPDTTADVPANTAPTTASTSLSASSPTRTPFVAPTHIRINEFVADPVDGEEWIELVNTGSTPVNLADWVIEDGAETRTVLTGAIGIGEQRFTTIVKPKGQLNNSGDRIVLKNPGGNTIDAVTYGDWNDGKVADNAPAASDPASVARVVDGADTDDDRLDFVRTETPTRGTPNIVASAPPVEDAGAPRSTSSSPQVLVVLNELYPNPPGDDRADEYIEIASIGTHAVDVSGWRVRDKLGAEYVIATSDGAASVPAGGFLVLPRQRTGIALNDTGGEAIRLYKPGQERATSIAEYSGEAPEGVAWARAIDGRWGWTTERTPNAVNIIAVPNRAPDAVFAALSGAETGATITFDGSDSADPDREPLAYLWDFGDDATDADHATDAIGRYVYERPGTYTVTLAVTDARGAIATAKRRITVRASEEDDGVAALVASVGGRSSELPIPPISRATRARSTSRQRAAAPTVALALNELPTTDIGTQVIVRGTVAASPGSVGTQVFHIADDDGGVEVFVGKRAIPALENGDRVEVRGELREVSGGLRVGIATASDVRILGKGASVAPEPLRAHEASAERIGSLVSVEGEVVEVRGRVLQLDDGSDEIRVALPASGAAGSEVMRVGDTIRVTGVVRRTSAGYRVLARSESDIVTVARTTPRDRAVAPAAPAPLRNDLELALLGGGGSALLASSLWRRRRIAILAFTATRKLLSFRRAV